MIEVWRTRGTKFHSRADCVSLLAGQDKAASEGKQTYAPVLTPLKDIQGEYNPCLTCWKDESGWFDGWLPIELAVTHQSGQADGSDWESVFLRQVLEKLPSLSPQHVTAQDVVPRNYGSPLRPDFTINVPGWQRLAIEVDGDKERWYADALTREGVLRRDDELEKLGFRVVHFTNTQVTQDAEWCRTKLERVLDELEKQARSGPVGSDTSLMSPAGTKQVEAVPGPAPRMDGATDPNPSADNTSSSTRLIVASVVAVLVAILLFGRQLAIDEESAGMPPDGSGQCDSEHPVKGNVSQNGDRIYHEPGWEFYARTDPEECFASGREAGKAGYRASERQ